jgi:hypothetical protein
MMCEQACPAFINNPDLPREWQQTIRVHHMSRG